jgi:hypothetical protein
MLVDNAVKYWILCDYENIGDLWRAPQKAAQRAIAYAGIIEP